MLSRPIVVALVIAMLASSSHAATLTATDSGISIDAGSFGQFTLTYPALDVGGAEPLKPIEKTAAGKKAVLKYVGDTRIDIDIAPDGAVSYTLQNPPAGLKNYRMEMLIDFAFSEGGTWRMGAGAASPFPRSKPDKPHLYQGNSSTFTLTNFEGKSVSFTLPPYAYEQLTDNREWNWKIFNWMFNVPFDRNNPRATIRIQEESAGARRVIVADRFGQDAALDFPGKVKSEEELKQDVARDEAYYNALQPLKRDSFGGLPDSRTRLGLAKTGFFHIERKQDRWWLVDPEGNACFHFGICGFQPSDDYTYVKGREQVYEWLPPYDSEYRPAYHPEPFWSHDAFSFYVANVIRKYGRYDKDALQRRMVHRVRQLGFNAVGAFAEVNPVYRELKFPWVATLPLGNWSLGHQIEGLRGLFDPFDPQTAAKMDELFARTVKPQAQEPLLIGYFLDNEQAFEDIPRVLPSLKASAAAKQRLIQMLERKYQTVAAFNTAWGTRAASFENARDMGLPVTTKAAAADMNEFTGQFIEAYYKLIHDTFQKYDKNHMLIGNRWQPGTANNEQLCRIAGKYCPLLSLNYYTNGVDKPFLDRLYKWSGERPFLLSEFYWSSPAESGLPGGREVKSQRERGLAYRNYVEQAAATGFVVGIEWFTLIDQARTGRWFERYNGENANTGLFNVADRPYKDFLAEVSQANNGVYDVLLGQRPPFAWDDPRFQSKGTGRKTISIPHATGPMKLDGQRDDWPGTPPETVPSSRLVMGADGTGFSGAFRLCWDESKLYVLVQVADPTPLRNAHRGADLWNGDGIELFVGYEDLERDGSLQFSDRQVLISAGEPPDGKRSYIAHAPAQVPCAVTVSPAVDGKGYVLEAAIPFAALGFTPKEGQVIAFDLAIDDGSGSGRQRQLMWSGGARNSGDRTEWGRARFVK